jgi:O-antigen ligase
MEDAISRKKTNWRKPVEVVLKFQPLFAIPIYFTVLIKAPPFWASLIIALIPLGLRFLVSRRFLRQTPFDLPVIVLIIAMLVGLVIAPYKDMALGALYSTLASVLIYYGIVENSEAGSKYWFSLAVIICLLTLTMSFWFFAQGHGREFVFNRWAFRFFSGLIGNKGPSLSWNSVAALLVVVIPPFFSITLFKNHPLLRALSLVAGLVFTGILFMTDSGGGWIALVCGLAIMFVCWRFWLLWVVIPAVGFISGIIVIFFQQIPWLMRAFSWDSFLYRTKEWSNTFHLLKGYTFFTGLGPGNWVGIYDKHYKAGDIILHSSYFQFYTDAGILGIAALIIAAVIFVRLSLKIRSSSRQNPWQMVGIGLIGSIIAGAVFACYDVTFSGTLPVAAGYIYFSIPLLWIIVALFVVSYQKLSLSCQSPQNAVRLKAINQFRK